MLRVPRTTAIRSDMQAPIKNGRRKELIEKVSTWFVWGLAGYLLLVGCVTILSAA
jgi:hypothetical protein